MMLEIAAGVILGNLVTGLFVLGVYAFTVNRDGAGAFLLATALLSAGTVVACSGFVR